MKQTIFEIQSNVKIARDTYKMVLTGDTADITRPGQFVNILLEGKFLRRPISVCDVNGDELTIIYKVVGEGTEQMAAKLTRAPKEEKKEKSGINVDYAAEVANRLSLSLGRKVKLIDGKKTGKIELEFYGADDREALIEALEKLFKK